MRRIDAVRRRAALVAATLVACASPPRAPAPESGRMPTSFAWTQRMNGGNCMYGGAIDAQGQVIGSSGCEQSAYNWTPRTLGEEERARFVAALDRLRASFAGEVDAAMGHCGNGLSLVLMEQSGRTRAWNFCDSGSGPGAEAKIPAEVGAVLGTLPAQ